MTKYQNFTFIKFEKIYNEYLNYLINDINKLILLFLIMVLKNLE